MFSKLMPRLSPATPIALVALFVALGGVSYAAATIGTSEIEKGAVTAPKLKKNAVTTIKLRANAVTGAKVKESTLGQVPSAAKSAHATSADSAAKAGHANTAGSADSAGDSLKLGGVAAAQFGSGIVGAAVTAPPAVALAPSGATGAPIGSGDEFRMPIPAPMKIKNLFVRVAGDASRPFVLSLRNPGGQAITCGGAGACANPSAVSFEPGDQLELAVSVLPGPAVFGGATYQVGYQIVP